jgi:hypothetical protein
MKRSWWQALVGLVTLGILPPGCSRTEAPLPPADVTMLVPGLT